MSKKFPVRKVVEFEIWIEAEGPEEALIVAEEIDLAEWNEVPDSEEIWIND